MADIEKVIKELNECIEHIRKNKFNKIPCWGNCQSAMIDAVALLKEQHPKTGHWDVLTMCANEGTYCSVCHTKIFDFVHPPKKKLSQYCPHCGAKMEDENNFA